jgi:fermentation-respiration switch protein FrsA (DUF1100 family)
MRTATVLGLIPVLVALLLLALWLGQRRLIYFPQAPPVPAAAAVAPDAVDATYATGDGLELRGWFFPAESGGHGGAVIVFPGNAGSREFRVPLAAAFARRGWSVLLVDYRGYGGNPGSPTEAGLKRDARAARAWLASRPGLDPTRIVYFGESLGAAVAIALAAEQPPAALVLRSPFTSLVDVARVHYPWLPVRLLLRDRYASNEIVPEVDCPLLVIAGERDFIVPEALSRRLFEAAGTRAKRYVSMPGADHNDPALTAGEVMFEEIAGFLSEEAGFPSRRVR